MQLDIMFSSSSLKCTQVESVRSVLHVKSALASHFDQYGGFHQQDAQEAFSNIMQVLLNVKYNSLKSLKSDLKKKKNFMTRFCHLKQIASGVSHLKSLLEGMDQTTTSSHSSGGTTVALGKQASSPICLRFNSMLRQQGKV
jgi:hypothetical protein